MATAPFVAACMAQSRHSDERLVAASTDSVLFAPACTHLQQSVMLILTQCDNVPGSQQANKSLPERSVEVIKSTKACLRPTCALADRVMCRLGSISRDVYH